MTEPVFGLTITTLDNEVRPAVYSDMSVVGLIGTAPDADALIFPVDTPVSIYSDEAAKLTALGATGTLADAVRLINAQLGEFQVAARIVVVRVAAGVNADATITNMVGNGSTTGLSAFLRAGPELGVIPRLIIAPGFTSQTKTGVASITIGAQGSGYLSAPTVAITGGGGTGATATAVLGTGPNADKVVGVTITAPGTGYTSIPTVAFSGGGGGTGATATATIGALANPVCAALPPVLNKLLAHAVVDGPATDQAAAINWRETISSERIIPVEPAVKILSGTQVVTVPMSPAVVGIAVRRDHEFNGRPFHSWANQAMHGILGPSRPLNFSLTDGATEGQALLAANIGVLVRGEMGVETAIASGGFVFIGTDNAGDDDLWRFYNVTRGRDYIHLMLLKTLRFYLGKFNITGQTLESVISTMKFALRDLRATGDILGYEIRFDRDLNSPDNLRLGKVVINFSAEEAPVLRYLGIQSSRYRPALDALLDDLLAQVGVING